MSSEAVAIIRARIKDVRDDQKEHVLRLIRTLKKVSGISDVYLLLPDDAWHRGVRGTDYGCEVFAGDAANMNLRIAGFLERAAPDIVVDCSLLTRCLEPKLYADMLASHVANAKPYTTPHLWSPEYLPKIFDAAFCIDVLRRHDWPYYNHISPHDTNLFTPDTGGIVDTLLALSPLAQAYVHELSLRHEKNRSHLSGPYAFDPWIERARHLLGHIDELYKRRSLSVLEIGAGKRFGLGLLLYLCGIEAYRGVDILIEPISHRQFVFFSKILQYRQERGDCSLPAFFRPVADVCLDYVCDSGSSFCNGAVQHLRMDAATMAFRDEEFDFVFSDVVLEHVQDCRNAISEMFRVIKPGGFLRHSIDFTSHLRGEASCRVKHLYMSRDAWSAFPHDTYINLIRPDRFYELFINAGFKIVSVTEAKNPHIDVAGAHNDHMEYGVSGLNTTSASILLQKS